MPRLTSHLIGEDTRTPDFLWALETQTQVLTPVQEVPYALSHLPSPQIVFLLNHCVNEIDGQIMVS